MKLEKSSVAESPEDSNDNWKPLIKLLILVLIVWVAYGICALLYFGDGTEKGVFGDMFGALNALFSAFAFACLIFTAALQRKELALQRHEVRMTRAALESSAEAQVASEKTLREELEVQHLSTLLQGLMQLVRWKLDHICHVHGPDGCANADKWEGEFLFTRLVEVRIQLTDAPGHKKAELKCLIEDLDELIQLKGRVKAITSALQAKVEPKAYT